MIRLSLSASSLLHGSAFALVASAALITACGSGGDKNNPPDEPEVADDGPGNGPVEPGEEDGVFESADPGQIASDEDGFGDDAAAGESLGGQAADGAGAPTANAADDSASVARDIEEADIVKIDGDTLYALSQFGGLSVIDIANPKDMRLLGRFKVTASPFEMYVRDSVAMVLYNGYGEYSYDEAQDLWTWYQTSYVVAIDTSAPDDMRELGRFHIPGYISDSRIVGDALYVVAFRDGYCWGCSEDDGPQTHVMSLDVADVSDIELVDELSFQESNDSYSWRRSVMATDQRLYFAGPTWSNDERPVGSTIQVVDISDPGGDMVEGASVEVGGQIESRWQMDEFEGVLRVISQPFTWWNNDQPPTIETFAVASAQELSPLGSTEMQIPRNETLRSVRFDGPRGYAITAEQMDPLFTIDLADAENPRQVGELEMPGWVYHMEPRGDRVLGLGYDQGNEEGAITVSLFDVSNIETPTMIERVNFGGDWGSLAEDQDRIHKAFKVLENEGLLLVPFSGWSYDEPENSEEEYCWNSE